ncbi:hypothetical protein RAB80_006970 [Fusarium oxysporum f. sp. vasinfectum]|nr:hypothetical protein RAB80_006970 [Fusarium oxysporum f. sp. vasinfectum]KAK2923980.1 hypothetical protein FoTM2_016137 [Fusarium oxysporum f. sp. vasinfectum]WKT41732.1 hypothetical protein QSH57_006538 [Fusarium oxysporum f. sp. vasinfectum]
MAAPRHVHDKEGSTTSWCALVLAVAPVLHRLSPVTQHSRSSSAFASHRPLAAMPLPNLVWLKFEGKAGRFSK